MFPCAYLFILKRKTLYNSEQSTQAICFEALIQYEWLFKYRECLLHSNYIITVVPTSPSHEWGSDCAKCGASTKQKESPCDKELTIKA